MLFLDRQDVSELLPMADCIAAVEQAFVAQAAGRLPAQPAVLGVHVAGGGFHVKAAALGTSPGYFAAKINSNFPGNPSRHGLPAIQGVIGLFDTESGAPLALFDSIAITTLRTAAASALAAKFLARRDAATLAICGCGNQGRAHVEALRAVRPIRRVIACDVDAARAQAFVAEIRAATGLEVRVASRPAEASARADIVVTCTPARAPILGPEDVAPGQFIAAVGADSEGKHELDARLLAKARVVTDLTAQSARMGDLQHAIAAGLMTAEDVHAEIGQIVSGARPGRSDDREIFVYDSTGTALQDVAAAALVYERAREEGTGRVLDLDGGSG